MKAAHTKVLRISCLGLGLLSVARASFHVGVPEVGTDWKKGQSHSVKQFGHIEFTNRTHSAVIYTVTAEFSGDKIDGVAQGKVTIGPVKMVSGGFQATGKSISVSPGTTVSFDATSTATLTPSASGMSVIQGTMTGVVEPVNAGGGGHGSATSSEFSVDDSEGSAATKGN